MLLQLAICALAVMVAAQPQCDPQTQYEKNGECCKMCGPGTRMASSGTCQDPRCMNCEANEYQDVYTQETKCRRQPYCDRNKNFEVPVPSTTKQNVCVCKPGFHCSSEECLTCVSHDICPPGQQAHPKGNHTHNTVCRECPEGTFSNESSWDSVCTKWTECADGFQIQQSGTDRSDNVCEKTSRAHVVAIGVIVSLLAVVCIIGALVHLWRGKGGDPQSKLKGCVESCLGEKNEPKPKEPTFEPLVTTPTDQNEEQESICLSSQEEHPTAMSPEENEDNEPSAESPTDGVFSDRGNFVTQEDGKREVLSRQESQTQTFTD